MRSLPVCLSNIKMRGKKTKKLSCTCCVAQNKVTEQKIKDENKLYNDPIQIKG